MRILCVCRGNTCRSPMAEGAIRARAVAAGLEVVVDSAGTGVSRTGAPPDPRGLAAAGKRGYDNSALRARPVVPDDFTTFDLILAMDRTNLADLIRRAPHGTTARIDLFHPDAIDVPDPFHGGPGDYDHALDLIETGSDALIDGLREGGARPVTL